LSDPAQGGKARSDRTKEVQRSGRGPRPARAGAGRPEEPAAALQHAVGNAAVNELIAGQGAPVPPTLRRDMEQRFGHDFSAVRVHDNPRAADLAASLSAKAFTVGPHIAFSRGRFAPDTRDGKRLLGHELAHVVQQSRGGTFRPTLDGSGRLEADATEAEDAIADAGSAAVQGASAVGLAAQPEDGERPEVVGVNRNDEPLSENDVFHDARGNVLTFDDDRGWLQWNGNDWIVSPTANFFVTGAAPAEKKSGLEQYAEGVYEAVTGIPETLKDTGAKVVDMTTQGAAVLGKATGWYDIGYTTWSSTSQQYKAGVSRSELRKQAFSQAVDLVVPEVSMAKSAIAAAQGDLKALGNLTGGGLIGHVTGGGAAADEAATALPSGPRAAAQIESGEALAVPEVPRGSAPEPPLSSPPGPQADVPGVTAKNVSADDTPSSPEAPSQPIGSVAAPKSPPVGPKASRIPEPLRSAARKVALSAKMALGATGESGALPKFAAGGENAPSLIQAGQNPVIEPDSPSGPLIPSPSAAAAATPESASVAGASGTAATSSVADPTGVDAATASPVAQPGRAAASEDQAHTVTVIQMEGQRLRSLDVAARLLEGAAEKQIDQGAGQQAPPKQKTDAASPQQGVAPSQQNVAPPSQTADARRIARAEKGEAVWTAMEQLGERFGMDAGVSPGDRIRLENKANTRKEAFKKEMNAAGYQWVEKTTEQGWSGNWEPISDQANPKKAATARRRYNKATSSIAQERNDLLQKARKDFFGKESGPTTLDLDKLYLGPSSQDLGPPVDTPVQPDVHLPLSEPQRVPGVKQGPAKAGLLARHEHQPNRGPDLISEHVQPGAQYKDLTKSPHGQIYDDNQYGYDKTILLPKDVADIKTHEGPRSDNKRTEALREKAAKGDRIDIIQDVFLPSLSQTFRAFDIARRRRAADTGSVTPATPELMPAPAGPAAAPMGDQTAPATVPAAAPMGDQATPATVPAATPLGDQAAPATVPPAPQEQEKPLARESTEHPPGGGALHGATQAANEGAALVRAYDTFEDEQERSGTPKAALLAGKTYLENTNIFASTLANYHAKLKDGQDEGDALVSTLGETLGGFMVPGKGTDQAINAAANLTDALDDHAKRGDPNAAANEGKATLRTGADFAAELTPSRMYSETLGAGARAYFDIGRFIGGDAKGVDKFGDDVTKGKLGMVFQPAGMAADFLGNLGSGEGASKALDKTMAKAKGSTLEKIGSKSGDLLYDLGQSEDAKAGKYGIVAQGASMLLGATSDHIAGKSWGQAFEKAAQAGKGSLADKIGSAGGDLAFAAHEKAVEVIDQDIPKLEAAAQEKVDAAKATAAAVEAKAIDKANQIKAAAADKWQALKQGAASYLPW
jgi:Domain of unknown function (DUF4157)